MKIRKTITLLLAILLVVSCPFTLALAAEVDEPHIHTEDSACGDDDDADIVTAEISDGEVPEQDHEVLSSVPDGENDDAQDVDEVENHTGENDEPETPTDIPDDDLFIEDMEALALDGGISLYASQGCGIGGCTCTGSCSWAYTNYSPSSSTTHTMDVYCTGCGAYAITPVSGSHSFSGNTCTLCGYTKACSHSSTSKVWTTSCNWKNVCNSCGATVSSGTTHGPYTYGSWSYYNATQHRRSYTCSYGDSGTYYETASHSSTTQYAQYSSTQHSVSSYCATCNSTIGTVSYADHSFTYGAWETYSATQHRRTGTCSVCGYSEYETADHTDTDNNGCCDSCGYLMTRFSVTVPALLCMTVSEHGVVYSSDEACIVNSSTDAVKVSAMTVVAENGWTLIPYSADIALTKVDTKQIGFAINNAETEALGAAENLRLPGDWTIAKGGSMPLCYDAIVSAMSEPVDEQVLTLIFVLDWADK